MRAAARYALPPVALWLACVTYRYYPDDERYDGGKVGETGADDDEICACQKNMECGMWSILGLYALLRW